MKHIGIIDVGSNSVRLLFAEITSKSSFKILTEFKEYVRLGSGFDSKGNITDNKIDSLISVLNLYKNFCNRFEDTEMVVTATEAFRRAKNQESIIQTVKNNLNLNIRVLSGEEEAYYDYFAAINTLDIKDGLIMDIGGSSTELILVANRTLKECVSLQFGAITLIEKFNIKDSIDEKQEKMLKDFLLESFSSIPWLKSISSTTLIGIGGSIRNIGKISKKQKDYPLNLIHNYIMPAKSAEDIYNDVKNKTLEQRKKIKGLSKDRADIFVGASLAVSMLVNILSINEIIICRNGLREGLLLSKLFHKKPIDNILDFSINNVLINNSINITHSFHVYKLTSLLFSSLQSVHKINISLDKVIKTASMFHNAGVNISYYYHHRHSAYIILNSSLYGISHKECVMSACIDIYQRSENIQSMLNEYGNMLEKEDIYAIKVIGILLRIAENLDKDLSGSIYDLKCIVDDAVVIIKTYSKEPSDFLISEAQNSSGLFKNTFNKSLYIV
ncbi:exopolyphosphatase/guanosine-5'-triphosphate,3'-diphosphate pyrophosphatase [Clostridium acetobutylicum]|uniref:Exopolyphosphatase n=1 Tax=Clostridium acetobutylicum (strain ATCC 824 / DSM 792 / JCM 1419 / IAM 19013 / LMG 5710 / NBRC 13948 / NRRL B-527 / VKM B-1787 / 2291 / W) TaxID=272562 RepID=Q97LE1_CLOAB|nr:Exopolyphosphatase [Clostridium acetobutylicum ATCC 824]ADZ19672.1 Exopolyphosphatase [Clostridium acetobutylicum EA 2018]AEI31341.1 exopolyphosphatase [Clostridium acetobutylicum DSM 1731]AWV80323.1 exopolyphosphatase [Clostridium acetobutylicum]PSM06125.1 exopolyphosphatase [Clostridium sp. NJ4]